MNNLFRTMSTCILLTSLTASAAAITAKSAIDGAAKAGQFLAITFYETDNASFKEMIATAGKFKKETKVKFTNTTAILSEKENLDLATKFGVRAADCPITLMIAPNGAITGGFPAPMTIDQLKQSSSVSELMLKTLKPLQDQKVVLVALQNSTTSLSTDSWNGVNDFVNDPNYKTMAVAVKADPASPGSKEFLTQCQLSSTMPQATVVVLLPPGRIGKVLTGATTKSDIVGALQTCAAGSSCSSPGCSDRRFKLNINPLDSALAKVVLLQGVNFTWNRAGFPGRNFPDGKEIGFIAQDLETVVPEVVRTDFQGYKSISYDKLTAILVESIKELNKKSIAQDSIIAAQNSRILALEKRR